MANCSVQFVAYALLAYAYSSLRLSPITPRVGCPVDFDIKIVKSATIVAQE